MRKGRVPGSTASLPIFRATDARRPDFLFRHADIAARLPEAFGEWLTQAERLSAVRALYMSAVHGKSFLELRLLSLAQAAEAHHRRLHEGQDFYMDANAYNETVLPVLQQVIPENLDSSHRQSLRNRLKFGNEFSFRKRLTMLFEEHDAALGIVAPEPSKWIEPIVRTGTTSHTIPWWRTAPRPTRTGCYNATRS